MSEVAKMLGVEIGEEFIIENADHKKTVVLAMDGLGDYDRNSGYIDGDVSLTNETKKFNYERGRKLKTD